MPNDPVSALRNLSARAVEEACRELALALSAEEIARRGAVEAEGEIDREIEAAARLTSTDADVELLRSWLPLARHRASAARAAAESACGETGRRRAVLAAARAVAEAADNLAAQRGVEVDAAMTHAEEKASDAVGRRVRLP